MNIHLTQEEVQQLVSLLDAAVRGAGLNAAKSAAVIFDKLQAAADAANMKFEADVAEDEAE